jgi:TrmH family RNA methyltransferase
MRDYKPVTNNIIKLINSLDSKKERKVTGLFKAEGEHLVEELLQSDFCADKIIIKNNPTKSAGNLAFAFYKKNIPVFRADEIQFKKISDTKTPQDILALVKTKLFNSDTTAPFVGLDGISDPGNVGAIIRTADWFGFRQILLGKNCADIFNPKVVRATQGAIFRCKFIETDNLSECIKNQFNSYEIFGAEAKYGINLSECKPETLFGVILGSESEGFSPEVSKIISKRITIEGKGKTESLNVAVAAGISLYHFAGFLKK